MHYDPRTKITTYPLDPDGTGTRNFDACQFIKEDQALLANFYKLTARHKAGHDVTLYDIEVY